MKYNFKIASKISKSNKHLEVSPIAGNTIYLTSKLDINDIPNSSFPEIISSLSHKDWEKVGKKGRLTKTIVTKTSVIITKD